MLTARLVVTVRHVTRTPTMAPTTIRTCHDLMWWEGVTKCSPLMGYYEYGIIGRGGGGGEYGEGLG